MEGRTISLAEAAAIYALKAHSTEALIAILARIMRRHAAASETSLRAVTSNKGTEASVSGKPTTSDVPAF